MAKFNEQAIYQLIVNGELAAKNMKDLAQMARSLQAEFRTLTDPADKARVASMYQAVNKEIREGNALLRGNATWWSRLSTEVKQFGVIAAGYLGFQFITAQVTNLINKQARLSDQLADIRKTTGLAADQIDRLNKNISRIDTRTSTTELRNIAIVAGQLGIAQDKIKAGKFNEAREELEGFVKSIDTAVVALGDEFQGGAEEVATKLGKLRMVFTDIRSDKVDQDLLRIGNALNVLASEGAATGPVVADFSNRIGGVGIPLGLTTAQVLGLSATLQELNVNVERGGTAVSKIFQKMSQDTEAFAKIAGKPLKEFTATVNSDIYGAFLQVLEGAQKSQGAATEFAKILDSLGVDGAGASEVFAKLGSNIDLLSEKVETAGSAIRKTDSITAEFNIKNATLGATVDKLGKEFFRLVSSDAVTSFFKGAVGGALSFIQWLQKMPEHLRNATNALLALAGATLIYYQRSIAALAISTAQTAQFFRYAAAVVYATYATRVKTAASEAYAAVVGLVTGRVAAATAAQRAWALVAAINPFTGIVAALTAIAIGTNLYIKNSEQALKVERMRKDTLDALNKANESVSKIQEDMNAKVDQFNRLSPTEQQNILETIRLRKQNAIAMYEELQAKAKAAAAEAGSIDWLEAAWANITSMGNVSATASSIAFKSMERSTEAAKKYDDKIKELAGSIRGLNETQMRAEQIRNAEADAMKIQTNTEANIQARIELLQLALKNAIRGSEDYKRIAGELAATQALLEKSGPDPEKAQKAADSFAKAIRSMQDNLRDLQVEAIRDQTEREFAELALAHEKRIAQANREYEELLKTEGLSNAQILEARKTHHQLLISLQEKYQRDLADLAKKSAEELSRQEMRADLDNLQKWKKTKEAQLSKDRAEGLLSEDAYQQQLNELQLKYLNLKILNLRDYAGQVPEVNDELVQAEKELNDLLYEIRKSGYEDILELSDDAMKRLTGAQKKELAALIAELKTLWTTGVSSSGDGIEQLMSKIKKIISGASGESSWKSELEKITQYVQEFASQIGDIWSSMNRIMDNRDRHRLNQIRAGYDQQRQMYDRFLKSKAISQAEYDRKMEGLDKDMDRQEKRAARDSAIRAQRLAIFQATIAAALGIARALAGPFEWPYNLVIAALQGAALFAQIKAIKSEPLPELGRGKLFTGIGKHPVSRQKVVESSGEASYVEDGEMLLSAATVENNPELMAYLDASLNNGGKLRKSISPAYIRSDYPQINTYRIAETASIRQEGTFGPAPRPNQGRVVTNIEAPDPQDGRVVTNLSADGELLRAINRLNEHLEQGIEAKIEYRRHKKDLSRLDKITGGKPL
jgi:TP901 family phage tail tape measure protein